MTAGAGTLAGRRLYLCVPDRPDLAQFVEQCITGGVDVVQLRDKRLEARDLLRRAEIARDVCAALGVPFILNDRPDLAVECGADGVHVGQDDAPPSLARRLMGAGAIVGLSTHGPEELAGAMTESVDYISVGPVVATPTKPGRPGTGLAYVEAAARTATVPWFVTGAVAPDKVAELVSAGADRFVVVRYLTEAANPLAAARGLRATIERELEAASRPAGASSV